MKKRVLSASTVTGDLTLGNYIGAINNWTKMQEEYECLYMVADLHALTVPQDPKALHERTLSFYAQYLALGLDPKKNIVFVQSQVPQHAELAWLLNCIAPMGALNRMTQFKDKSARTKEINNGLYSYPVLMAADILLYRAHLVPVGQDQKQHLELTRDLAESFNRRFESCLVVPEPFIAKKGAKIMSLQDPSKKMSKSDEDPKSFVSILDNPKKMAKKIKGAVTDSDPEARIAFDEEGKPGLSNLLTLFSILSEQDVEKVVQDFQGKMYGHLKVALADLVVETFHPVQERYDELMTDKAELEKIMGQGAYRARSIAEEVLTSVYKAQGLVRRLPQA